MNPDALLEWAERVQATPLGVALGESTYAFALIEGVHLIALSVSVGLLFLIDLRMIGLLFAEIPLDQVLRQLRRPVLAGFALVFASGILLFWAEAATAIASPAFPFKLLFILLAGLNALYFERVIAPRCAGPEDAAGVRGAGLASLALWTLVIVCGRLIPYLPDWS